LHQKCGDDADVLLLSQGFLTGFPLDNGSLSWIGCGPMCPPVNGRRLDARSLSDIGLQGRSS
ncbi:MAG: hypothetical protein WC712_11980, partial [Candidatus Brocadiia bacterium]